MAEKTSVTKQDSPVSPVSPVSPSSGLAESPTTAQPLDFDDDDHLNAPAPASTLSNMSATENTSKPAPPPKDDAPPAKPPRPIDPRDQAEQTLREAFPTIDPGVIKAVLTASRGQVEPAFAALLEMTDPDAAQREQPPARPPRPSKPQTATQQSQLEADELYARQLAEHYENTATQRPSSDRYNSNLQGSRQGKPGQNPNPDDYQWRSFIDDDLPEIRDNIKKGFIETQKTVNSWITTFKKNFDAVDGDDDIDHTSQNARPPQQPQRRSADYARRSAEYSRYDADPQVIGDDFSKLDLKDGDHPPRTTSRPAANPNLFKSDRRASSKGSGRKVSFQDGPPEEITDMYASSPRPATATATATTSVQVTGTTAGKASKWQPLSSVEQSPVADNDPFSLGDSDDEKDAKPITMKDEEADKKTVGAVSTVKEPDSKKAKVEDEK